MSKRKPKRLIYKVEPHTGRWWCVNHAGDKIGGITKVAAVRLAVILAKNMWSTGLPAQVLVRKQNGRYQIEYSYGCESKRKG